MVIPYHAGEPLTCQQIRELDILAIEHVGIPGQVLMENAGRAVSEFIYSVLLDPTHAHVVVLCGSGNNGGDGYVVARQLRNASVATIVVLCAARDRIQGDAAANLRIYERLEAPLIDATSPQGLEETRRNLDEATVIVDALLGSGAEGSPRGLLAEVIDEANRAPRAKRVAIDIPSGLNADTGEVGKPCFRADATITFVAAKTGFSIAAAREVLGRVVIADIGVPRELIPGRKQIRETG